MLTVPLGLSLALPAAALADDLPGHAAPLGVADGLLIFLVIPVGVFFVVALLTLRPWASSSSQRYRPGRDWSAEPSWTGARPAGELTEGAATDADGKVLLPHTAGGRHAPVMAGTPHQEHARSQEEHDAAARQAEGEAAPPTASPRPPTETGGASGSW
ncbi:MAG TPA: hypothetical protein VF288_14515 [Mycobacteriales bacterium]